MSDFSLEIRTPEKALFQGKVVSLNVPAADGRLGVLADHAPLALSLGAGEIIYRSAQGETARHDCGGGFLVVSKNAANVLLFT
jgi:F-type H+-transporting ATPase subunit epsilon